jgi:hypothetical protein
MDIVKLHWQNEIRENMAIGEANRLYSVPKRLSKTGYSVGYRERQEKLDRKPF